MIEAMVIRIISDPSCLVLIAAGTIHKDSDTIVVEVQVIPTTCRRGVEGCLMKPSPGKGYVTGGVAEISAVFPQGELSLALRTRPAEPSKATHSFHRETSARGLSGTFS